MSLWNPYAFGPTGAALPASAPPALRVIDGVATAQQLVMAQAAFHRFCTNARLSPVPNPTEQGVLPDGTRYRIVVLGPQTIMEIWPTSGDLLGRGVGVSASHPGGIDYFVVAYKNGKWAAKAVDGFYGGQRVWVDTDGVDYFADNTWHAPPVADAFRYRRYSKTASPLEIGDAATTIMAGAGYGDGNGGVGMIVSSGGYAQVNATPGGAGVTLEVASARKITAAEIATTPAVPVVTPSGARAVSVSGTSGMELVRSLANGSCSSYRHRAGDRLGFPLFSTSSPANDWAAPALTPNQHFSPRHIEGAAEIVFGTDGAIGGSFAAAGVEQYDRTGRQEPVRWTVSHDRHSAHNLTTRYTRLALPWDLYGTVIPEPCGGGDSRVSVPQDYPYAHAEPRSGTSYYQDYEGDFQRLVYLSTDWNDTPVRITARGNVRVQMRDEYTEESAANGSVGTPTWSFDGGVFHEVYPTLIPIPASFEYSRSVEEQSRVERVSVSLDTPWGALIHKETDLSHTVAETTVVTPNPDGSHETTVTTAHAFVGTYRKNHVIFVDPLLSVLAYIGVFADSFNVDEAGLVTITSGYVELVVMAQGREIFSRRNGIQGRTFTAVGLGATRIAQGDWSYSPTRVTAVYPEIKVTTFISCMVEQAQYEGYTTSPNSFTMSASSSVGVSHNESTVSATVAQTDITPDGIDFSSYRVLSAVDPNSGGGVVLVVVDGEVVSSMTVDRTGQARPLASTVPLRAGSTVNPMAYSV